MTALTLYEARSLFIDTVVDFFEKRRAEGFSYPSDNTILLLYNQLSDIKGRMGEIIDTIKEIEE